MSHNSHKRARQPVDQLENRKMLPLWCCCLSGKKTRGGEKTGEVIKRFDLLLIHCFISGFITETSESKFEGQLWNVCLSKTGVYVSVGFLPNSPLADTRGSLIILSHTHLVATAFDLKTGVFGWI